jgi:hypothetical protein
MFAEPGGLSCMDGIPIKQNSATLSILIRDYNVRNDAAVLARFNDDQKSEKDLFLTNRHIFRSIKKIKPIDRKRRRKKKDMFIRLLRTYNQLDFSINPSNMKLIKVNI